MALLRKAAALTGLRAGGASAAASPTAAFAAASQEQDKHLASIAEVGAGLRGGRTCSLLVPSPRYCFRPGCLLPATLPPPGCLSYPACLSTTPLWPSCRYRNVAPALHCAPSSPTATTSSGLRSPA